jgi:asparagine synthetase B (glutamine-hydrolysing)
VECVLVQIDQLLCDVIAKESKEDEVAVLLSGGADSLSVALAAHRLGKKIHAYTFHLHDQMTYDFGKAMNTCNQMKWECTPVIVPVDNLISDFHRLRTEFGCVKKTHFECCYPFMYIYPQITQKEVLSGWAADGYFGVSKKANIHYKHTKVLFDTFRNEYFEADNRAGYIWHNRVAVANNKKFIAPYLDSTIKDYFYQFDWYEVNQPYQKHHVIEAFPEFQTIGKPKKHINLQLGSGIDKLFENLLQSTEINFKQRKRMLDVYRDWKDYDRLSTLHS